MGRFSRRAIKILFITLLISSCSDTKDNDSWYGTLKIPKVQELRWSDGGLPQKLDPASAVAPPDTDAVRALYEGLTEYDPEKYETVPGVATRWVSDRASKRWTFYLRPDARWTNGEKVTAYDFVRSWKRAIDLGPQAPHAKLLRSIKFRRTELNETNKRKYRVVREDFGAKAISENTLSVELDEPNRNFPSLVAHTVFRPVHSTLGLENTNPVTNGPFQISSIGREELVLERSAKYWASSEVRLDRVRFVQAYDAEKALLFYRRGNIDVVSNAAFEPLAIKLLQPYRDFRRETYAALTYYTINRQNFPFSDKRVREALAISIDRKRLSEDVAGGTTVPAVRLLPETAKSEEHIDEINEDAQRGRDLLALAGFPNGEGFPTIRLLINRNDQQRLLATFIATMWRGNLGLKTEIIIKEWDDYERLLYSGEFDIARRGVVMQATDEATSMRELFSHESNSRSELTEAEAMQDRRAIPIYFASSFSMVKPYVKGFETRLLDAPLLRTVRIDTQWQER